MLRFDRILLFSWAISTITWYYFSMLHTWNQWILACIVVFVSIQIISIECFFNWAHVSIHFEWVFDLKLLVKHVLVILLIFSPLIFFKFLHLIIMSCLHSCLIFVKVLSIVHLFYMILLILLHLKLLIVQVSCLLFLSFNKLFFIVIPLTDVVEIIYFLLLEFIPFIIFCFCNSFCV